MIVKSTLLDTSAFREEETFTVIHPFSPFSGKSYHVEKIVKKYGNTYIHFRTPDGKCHSVLGTWTDLKANNPANIEPCGHCLAYYEDLVSLNHLLKQILNDEPNF